jgi:hypothetical protein
MMVGEAAYAGSVVTFLDVYANGVRARRLGDRGPVTTVPGG